MALKKANDCLVTFHRDADGAGKKAADNEAVLRSELAHARTMSPRRRVPGRSLNE